MQKQNESTIESVTCSNILSGRPGQPLRSKYYKHYTSYASRNINTTNAMQNIRGYNVNLSMNTIQNTKYSNYFENVRSIEQCNLQNQSQSLIALDSSLNCNLKSRTNVEIKPYNDKINFNPNFKTLQKMPGQQYQLLNIKIKNNTNNSNFISSNYSKLKSEDNINDLKLNQFRLSDNKNRITKLLASIPRYDHTLNNIIGIDSTKQDVEYDSDSSGCSGDLNKLEIMTAAEFDRDRYARFGIHELEVKDYVRTITYKNCIEYCAKEFIKDKVVLVIRCGIGLLPLLCARNGKAKRVVALEQSTCIEYARNIVKDNMYGHKITLIQSSVRDLKQLPYGLTQVDVIVSDFMGDCVLSQGDQMEQVIEARDRFLKPNGLMIPMSITLYGQLLEQRTLYENQRIHRNKKFDKRVSKKINQSIAEAYDTDSSTDSTWSSWWSDVYGFDMRSKPEYLIENYSENGDFSDSDKLHWVLLSEPIIAYFDPSKVVSTACELKEFNMYKCTIPEVRHVKCKDMKVTCITPFTSANGGDYAHMLELFMVVDFPNGKFGQHLFKNKDAEDSIGFSTSSFSPKTRYKQTGLLLQDQLIVEQGDEFIINEFHIWRGPQQGLENELFKGTFNGNIYKKMENDENLKLRLRYSFANKNIKVIDRRCAYILIKHLF